MEKDKLAPRSKLLEELYFCSCVDWTVMNREFGRMRYVPDRLLITFIDGGSATFTLNNEKIVLHPNELMLLKPRQEICMDEMDENAKFSIVGLLPALQDVLLKQFSTSFFAYVKSRDIWKIDERTQRALRSFYDVFDYNYRAKNGTFSTEIANSLFVVFIQSFYQLVSDDVNAERSEEYTVSARTLGGRFFQLLNENYKREHSVTFYSEQLCISSKYLTQIVKKITNSTPKDIIDRRLGMESLFLLTKTNMNVQEISIELGFPDQSYFGRFFKRLFGISPLHYRLNPDMSLMEKLKPEI